MQNYDLQSEPNPDRYTDDIVHFFIIEDDIYYLDDFEPIQHPKYDAVAKVTDKTSVGIKYSDFMGYVSAEYFYTWSQKG